MHKVLTGQLDARLGAQVGDLSLSAHAAPPEQLATYPANAAEVVDVGVAVLRSLEAIGLETGQAPLLVSDATAGMATGMHLVASRVALLKALLIVAARHESLMCAERRQVDSEGHAAAAESTLLRGGVFLQLLTGGAEVVRLHHTGRAEVCRALRAADAIDVEVDPRGPREGSAVLSLAGDLVLAVLLHLFF